MRARVKSDGIRQEYSSFSSEGLRRIEPTAGGLAGSQELGVRPDSLRLGAAGVTVNSAVRIMVSLLSKSMAITSMLYLSGAKESTGKYRWIVSCSPPWCR